MSFEHFLGGWMRMYPFRTLVFTLWFVMVGQSFISSDDSFEDVVTFSTIAIQKPFPHVQNFLFAQFCKLLWDPSCTEGKPVVDNCIGWTTNNLQLMCHFIICHPSVLQEHAIDSYRVCISNGRGLASGSFPMLNACATILESTRSIHRQSVATWHWYRCMQFGTWYNFSSQKWITVLCSFLAQMKLECPYLWHKTHDRNGLSRSHLHHNGRKVDHVYLVMPNQQYSQLQNVYLHCG